MTLKDSFSLRTVRKKLLVILKAAGIVLILSYTASTRLPLDKELSFFLWILFVIVLLLVIDYLLGKIVTNPVSRLSETAGKMARLDFSTSASISANDEFGELSKSLNHMADNLRKAMAELEKANQHLEKEVEQERLLLAERKELVDQLSHEMKTPLGIIRAYAEGVQDETDEFIREKYTGIIIKETQRMGDLITTLLDLSALETGASLLTPERFDLVELVETAAGRLLIDVPDADFKLEYELPDHKVYVDTDKKRMEQVLDNLIVNAKKNVIPGGLIRISMEKQPGKMLFSVFNQSPSIPLKDLDKIWTKFYRSSHSKYSGSGLGLAIVSQILSMQDIPYGVCNLDDGVQFYFSIPIIE